MCLKCPLVVVKKTVRAFLEDLAHGPGAVCCSVRRHDASQHVPVAFAYKNVKFVLKHKVAQKREDAVSKEVTRKLSEADNRKMSRKEKDERILWKKNEVADYEATTFSIFYNNTLFLVLVIIASFFLLKNFNPTVTDNSDISQSTDESETTAYDFKTSCRTSGCYGNRRTYITACSFSEQSEGVTSEPQERVESSRIFEMFNEHVKA
ncbi:hypothetical protein Q7C36_009424 [Tachysurus vachellii]|uniref:Translocon-associated protein subunit gamma n=1 Tax=Tachysurus vachellii TaxID=175792 RepID=A0AA88SYL5_TACVA|nr:hypothetical protein Q7C36_009424 [Tachysurus vachellii]